MKHVVAQVPPLRTATGRPASPLVRWRLLEALYIYALVRLLFLFATTAILLDEHQQKQHWSPCSELILVLSIPTLSAGRICCSGVTAVQWGMGHRCARRHRPAVWQCAIPGVRAHWKSSCMVCSSSRSHESTSVKAALAQFRVDSQVHWQGCAVLRVHLDELLTLYTSPAQCADSDSAARDWCRGGAGGGHAGVRARGPGCRRPQGDQLNIKPSILCPSDKCDELTV